MTIKTILTPTACPIRFFCLLSVGAINYLVPTYCGTKKLLTYWRPVMYEIHVRVYYADIEYIHPYVYTIYTQPSFYSLSPLIMDPHSFITISNLSTVWSVVDLTHSIWIYDQQCVNLYVGHVPRCHSLEQLFFPYVTIRKIYLSSISFSSLLMIKNCHFAIDWLRFALKRSTKEIIYQWPIRFKIIHVQPPDYHEL